MIHGCNINKIPIGSVVVLDRFPGTKWIVCSGWYTNGNTQQNGIHLKSIPAGTVIPFTSNDAMHLEIISNGNCPPHIPHHPHQDQTRPIETYLAGVNYTEGQLVWLTAGEIYQVVSDFESSSDCNSVYQNLKKDVELGNLISIGSSDSGLGDSSNIGRISENAIDDLF